jgi:hypothetical protein
VTTQPDAIRAAFGHQILGMTKVSSLEENVSLHVYLHNGRLRVPLALLFDQRATRAYLGEHGGILLPRSTSAEWNAAVRLILAGAGVPAAGSWRSKPIGLCRELIRNARS